MSASPKSNEHFPLISTAVALAFAANATAAGLVDDPRAKLRYTPALINAIGAVTDDPAVQSRARGFMVELEKALKTQNAENCVGWKPGDQSCIIVAPRENSTNMLVVAAAVPAPGNERVLPAAEVCAQQNGKPLLALTITHEGKLIPRPVITNPEGSTRAACNATILSAKAGFERTLAEMNSGKPTPYSAPPPAAKPQAATPPQGAPPASAGTSTPSAAVTGGTQIRMITGRPL